MRKVLVIALLMPLILAADGAVLNKQEFTNAFYEQLKIKMPNTGFEVIGDLQIHTPDIEGYQLNIFLDNAYDVYSSGMKSMEQVFQDQLTALKNQSESFSNNNIRSIFPVLKPKDYIETARKQLSAAGYDKSELPFYYKKFNNDTYVLYVFDTEQSMRFVTVKDVQELSIQETISSIAKKNIEGYFANIEAVISQVDTGDDGQIFIFSADENYEASVLFATSYLETKLKARIEDFVVFVPARNIVLIVPENDNVGLELATQLATQGFSELGYSISPYGYVYRNGQWTRYKQ